MKQKKIFIGMLILAVALGVTINLSQKSQETRRKAAEGQCSLDFGCMSIGGEKNCNCSPLAAENVRDFKNKNYLCGFCGNNRQFSAAINLGMAMVSPIPLVTITKLEDAEGEINNSSMMIDSTGEGDNKFPIIPFQSKTDDYYKVIKCLNTACTAHVVDNLSHVEVKENLVLASPEHCGCSGVDLTCKKCVDMNKCQFATARQLNSVYQWCGGTVNKSVTYGEYCNNPDAFANCGPGIKMDPCVCCSTVGTGTNVCTKPQWIGLTPAHYETEKTVQGLKWYRTKILKGNNGLPMIAFNFIPIPTETPTPTPTPTNTPSPTPTMTITPTPGPYVPPPTIPPLIEPTPVICKGRCCGVTNPVEMRRCLDPISILSYKQFNLSPVPSKTPNTKITDNVLENYYQEAPFDEYKLSNLTSISLATDINKIPIILYFDLDDGALSVLVCGDEYCMDRGKRYMLTVIAPEKDSGVKYGEFHAMVVDNKNLPMIAFSKNDGQGNMDLMYIKCKSIDCSERNDEILLEKGDKVTGMDISMVYDKVKEVPIISYYDSSNGQLKIILCNDSFCSGTNKTVVVDDGNGFFDVGRYASMTMDNSGKPILAYYDVSNRDLKYARCLETDCSQKNVITIDSDGDTGQYATIAVGADGSPVISYFKVQTGKEGWIMLAKCANADCGAEPTSTPTNTPTATPTPTSIPSRCTCILHGSSCYEGTGGAQWNSCPGCEKCGDKNRGEGLPLISINTKYKCVPLGNKDVTLGEYCSDPTLFEGCGFLIDPCQCCNIAGFDRVSGSEGRCTEGVCKFTTATAVKICKSIIIKNVVTTNTPTPTPTPLCPENKSKADYNNDGIVNGADYVVWRNEFIDKVIGLESDGNCDGKVSISDYSKWREMYLK